jgi:basic membrane lipoprotein Med (substrate-binding protein (PBP1-ABC) superfamily)
MSKRWLAIVLAGALAVVAACGGSSGGAKDGSSGSGGGGALSVALMVPGALGDLGFFDSGEQGMKDAQSKLGAKTKTVEGGANNTAAWQSNLQALSTGRTTWWCR